MANERDYLLNRLNALLNSGCSMEVIVNTSIYIPESEESAFEKKPYRFAEPVEDHLQEVKVLDVLTKLGDVEAKIEKLTQANADLSFSNFHMRNTLSGVQRKLESEQQKNKELTTLLDQATAPTKSKLAVFGDSIDKNAYQATVQKVEQKSKERPKGLYDDLSEDELAEDEKPRLYVRRPEDRDLRTALRRDEVHQLRRYIASKRTPEWIHEKMGVSYITIASVASGQTYQNIVPEKRSKTKHAKPTTVHAGYGVESKNG